MFFHLTVQADNFVFRQQQQNDHIPQGDDASTRSMPTLAWSGETSKVRHVQEKQRRKVYLSSRDTSKTLKTCGLNGTLRLLSCNCDSGQHGPPLIYYVFLNEDCTMPEFYSHSENETIP